MAMGRTVRDETGGKRRILSKCKGSDGSDDDYEIGDDEDIDDSDVDCTSLSGEEVEDDISELEDDLAEEEKLRMTGRLKKCNGFPSKNKSRVGKASNGRKVSHKEDTDEDYDAEEDDDVEEEEDFDGHSKDRQKNCASKKQIGVQKAVKKKKASYTEESDDDYETEDDEYDDDDDSNYDDEEEEEDKDFSPDEIDIDDEDEFTIKKIKKVRKPPLQEKRFPTGRKRKRNSRASCKSKRKKPAKRRGFQKKLSSNHCKKAVKGKSMAKRTTQRNFCQKKRGLVLDSDSDFVDSRPLDQEYTISDEEREQLREAIEFCGQLKTSCRKPSLKIRRSEEEKNLHQERNHKAQKGKDKVVNSKKKVGKQVCGICFSEEGKKTIRGTLDCCSHYFCFTCIMEWSKVESRCPLCKQRFATISKPARSNTAFDLRTIVVPVPERDQVYQPSEEELRAYLDPYENVICSECHHGGHDALMLLCDLCDSPAHTFCVGLGEQVPEGNWYCEGCRPTALGSSNPQASNFTRGWRTTTDSSVRLSPSENVRELIDLNRVYEPEASLTEVAGVSSSPRDLEGGPRAAASVQSAGVRTVSQTRMRHRIAHFGGRTGGISVSTMGNNGWGLQIGGERRPPGSQIATRPENVAFDSTLSLGGLQGNFAPSVHSSHVLPLTLGLSSGLLNRDQTFTTVDGSANGMLEAGLGGIMGRDPRSVYGHFPLQ